MRKFVELFPCEEFNVSFPEKSKECDICAYSQAPYIHAALLLIYDAKDETLADELQENIKFQNYKQHLSKIKASSDLPRGRDE